MGRKITIIGAGSAVFTQGLTVDLIRTFGGEKWRLALVDTDPEALEVACRLCRKMLDAKSSDIELSFSTDRCEVLPGSDYVVTTIGVGGRRAWEQDVYIPRKYGIYQPVGDSVMPGGISRAMRMIPAMLEIARDVLKYCPEAYFFNYANPMTMICRAVRKYTDARVAGLCHGVSCTEKYLSEFSGLDRNRIASYSIGLNHLTFMYDIRHDGKDIRQLLADKLAETEKAGIDYGKTAKGFLEREQNPESSFEEPFAWELFKLYGVFAAPGDRHICEYYCDRFREKGSYYGKTLGVDAFSFEQTIEFGDRKFSEMKEIAYNMENLPEEYFKRFEGEHEQLTEIMHSIEHDERKVYHVNLPNNGAVPNLPKDTVLEMPASAAAKGIMPLQALDFLDILAGVISKHSAIAETSVEAAVKGDRNLFVEAVMLGGYITDRNKAESMVDELLKAQAGYLPHFA